MIMMGDKKKVLAAILGPHEPHGEPMESPDEMHTVGQEAIECVHNHDVAGFVEAIKALVGLCNGGEVKEEPSI